jgi:23S rRNA (adenine2503-C2)-methyltransferase
MTGPGEQRPDFYDFTRAALADFLSRQFDFPAYRAGQVFDWVYRKGVTDFAAMSNIGRAWREKLAEAFRFPRAIVRDQQESADGTKKFLLEVAESLLVETVLISQPGRLTLCLSTQCGCAMNCAFCRTGKMGLRRNLACGDIVRQVLAVRDDSGGGAEDFENVVFMGMGEPLQNYEAVVAAVKILLDNHAFNLGPRKVTISTSGFVPGIARLASEGLGVNLAVSLNATCDEQRNRLMPINRTYNLATLLSALRSYPLGPRRKLTIEYVMLAGVNDLEADLKRLTNLLMGLRVKVNLIPYNDTSSIDFQPSDSATISCWNEALNRAGIQTTVRWSRGSDINAACGQLASAIPKMAAR